MLGVRQRIELPQELDRLEILAAAEAIRHPLPLLARVVEIEHRGDRVDAEPVDVILGEPVERVGEKEIADLVAAVVEDQRAPVAMLALARIRVLVERGAVETGQRVGVLGKVPRHPVENHADAVLMALVHEGLELRRRTEPARRRIEARSPGSPRIPRTGAPSPAAARCACSPSSLT